MRLECENYGSVVVLTPMETRLDANISREFRETALTMIQPDNKVCAIDLSHVTFMDSSGMGALVGLMNRIGRDRRLEICCLSPAVKKVLRLTRMDTVFSIRDSVAPILSPSTASARAAGF